jgi:hypothetical protein
MAFVKTALDVFLRRKVWPKITSNVSKTKPVMAMIVGGQVEELDKLGDPNTGMMLGGRDLMGEATRIITSQNETHEVVFQDDITDVAAAITYRGSLSASTKFAEDSFTSMAFKWSDYWAPFKFGQHSIEVANNDQLKIQSILELSLQQAAQQLLDQVNEDMWTGALTEAQQVAASNALWPNVIGLQQAVDDGLSGTPVKFYGGVDRSTATGKPEIQGYTILAASLPDTKVRLNLIRRAKMVGDGTTGLCDTYAGAGTFAVTTATLFNTLMEEAEDRNIRVIDGGVPELGMEGFKQPMIQYGTTYITYDVECPSGEMYVLTPRSWVFEVSPGANFQLDGNIVENWKVVEAGGYYNWGRLHAKVRLVCREPHLQLKYTGLTAT